MERLEKDEEIRHEAIAYVEAVVARAEGAPAPPEPTAQGAEASAGRFVPAFVKRFVVRLLIKLNRHPFEHLAHPMQVEFEHRIAELHASVHAATRRADQAYNALQRAGPELERWRRTVADLERQLEALSVRVDELESTR